MRLNVFGTFILWVFVFAGLAQAQVLPEANRETFASRHDDASLPDGAIMRLGETLFRTGARITNLAFSPDGKKLASFGGWLYFEGRLSVWDVATGKELQTYSMDENQITGLAWTPNGRGFTILTDPMGTDGFRFWFFTDPADRSPPRRTNNDVRGVKVEGEKKAKKPAAGKNQPISMLPQERRVVRQLNYTADRVRMVEIGSDEDNPKGYIDIFEMNASAPRKKLQRLIPTSDMSLDQNALQMQFIRRGQSLALLRTTEKGSQQVVVWDIAKGTTSKPFEAPIGVLQGTRQSFDVAEDGSALAVGLEDGTIKVFDLPSGKERLSVKKHRGPNKRGFWSDVSVVKFVNGGRNILSAGRDNRQLVWDAKTGADVAALDGHWSWVEAVAVTPDGNLVATAGQDSLIRLWDARTWRPASFPTGPYETIRRLNVSRCGKYVAAASGDGIHVWELTSGKEQRSIPTEMQTRGPGALFTPAGDILVTTSEGIISHYPLPSGPPKQLEPKGYPLEFTPDGKRLLTAHGNSIFVWDWPTCAKRAEIPLKGGCSSAAIAPDGKRAVIAVGNNESVVIDLEAGKAISEIALKLHWFADAAGFGPDGRIVCGTGPMRNAKAEAWNVVTLSRVRQFESPPGKHGGNPGSALYIISFAVSADGRRSASCHNDGSLTVYETVSGQILAHFLGHRGNVVAVAMTSDGSRVLSGGNDHQVLVWDVSPTKLAGKVVPVAGADRTKEWDLLGTQHAKDAIKTIASFAADPEGTVAVFATKMKPRPASEPALLDRIFRDLDDPKFAVRDKADRELNTLGAAALGGVRVRVEQTTSTEVKKRANQFLRRFENEEFTVDRVRFARAVEILATMNTSAARRLLERLAGGAENVYETELALRALRVDSGGPAPR